MSKKGKPKSRWNRGNERYDKATMDYIYRHYREEDGWRNAARINKVKKDA